MLRHDEAESDHLVNRHLKLGVSNSPDGFLVSEKVTGFFVVTLVQIKGGRNVVRKKKEGTKEERNEGRQERKKK